MLEEILQLNAEILLSEVLIGKSLLLHAEFLLADDKNSSLALFTTYKMLTI
jgi:hypothetical protein